MRFVLIEDHPIFRLGMMELIRQRWPDIVFTEADTMLSALAALEGERPDMILLDLTLPDATGVESATRVIRASRGAPVLVVTSSNESVMAARLLKLGISGFVPKDQASNVLTIAIARILAGGRYISPELAARLVDQLAARSSKALPHESLSPQEYRVMLLIAEGKGPTEIAKAMRLSVKTVGTYRARVLMKAEWDSNTDLVKYCIQHKLTDPS